MRPLPIEHLAGAPPAVLGLAVIRGRPTPVVDLAALLNPAATPGDAAGAPRFVSLRLPARSVALRVQAVPGVWLLPAAELAALPPLWQGPDAPAVAALGRVDRDLLLVLEAARLLPPDWRPIVDDR